jgi:methionine-rich copper-binding protein CopC
MTMRFIKSSFIACAAALLSLSAANAHPRVTSAGPSPDSVVAASPKAISIQFNEAVVASFSGIELTNGKGEKQNVGAAASPTDKKQLVIPVNSELAPGKYTVAWHVVGDDTHKVEGKFGFEVRP